MESLAPTELSRSSSASTTLLHVMSAWHSPAFVVVKEDRERHVLSEKRCCCYWSVVGLDEHLDTFGAQYSRADQNTLRLQQRIPKVASPQIPTDPNPGYLLIFVSASKHPFDCHTFYRRTSVQTCPDFDRNCHRMALSMVAFTSYVICVNIGLPGHWPLNIPCVDVHRVQGMAPCEKGSGCSNSNQPCRDRRVPILKGHMLTDG